MAPASLPLRPEPTAPRATPLSSTTPRSRPKRQKPASPAQRTRRRPSALACPKSICSNTLLAPRHGPARFLLDLECRAPVREPAHVGLAQSHALADRVGAVLNEVLEAIRRDDLRADVLREDVPAHLLEVREHLLAVLGDRLEHVHGELACVACDVAVALSGDRKALQVEPLDGVRGGLRDARFLDARLRADADAAADTDVRADLAAGHGERGVEGGVAEEDVADGGIGDALADRAESVLNLADTLEDRLHEVDSEAARVAPERGRRETQDEQGKQHQENGCHLSKIEKDLTESAGK